ncbi:MAG: response regulator transcription factor [Bacteroidota bacterium]
MNRVLLVEDDKSFGYVLSEYLLLKNFQVVWEETVSAALKALIKHSFDIAILDVNLKNGSGYDVASEIKDKRYDIPFIFLTARDLKIDQLKGYRYGAEEYVTKPIDEEILLAKIQAVLSRQTNHDKHQQTLEFKTLTLDKSKRELKVDSTSVQLTERESLLLEMLISRSEKLVERKEILQRLWENQDEFSRNSMDVYISRLRKYLSEANISIRNVHGKGFVLE